MQHGYLRSLVLALTVSLASNLAVSASGAENQFTGSTRCADCHEKEYRLWRGSHHDLAMAEAAQETVLGDFDNAQITAHGVTSRFFKRDGKFFVRTDGPDGEVRDYPIRYTFGWYPLQQYLIEFPGGHLQSLGLAWDSRPRQEGGQRWFHLYPDEPMDHRHRQHWTSRDQTWNYQCAECHSTNLKKNYDPAGDSYRTTWSEIDVACEACHGPGSAHVTWAEAAAKGKAVSKEARKGLAVTLGDRDAAAWVIDERTGKPRRTHARENHDQIELCARCHSRRGQIRDHYEFGKPLNNTHRLALLEEHLYFPDGQIKDEVYVYGSFIQSRMYKAGVTCSDCHEPHDLKLRAEGNDLCARCHLPSRYDTEAHHHHPKGSTGSACTACHMPRRVYMVVDERADHSMRVPRPDLSVKIGTPNACNQCHQDRTAKWSADAVQRWYEKGDSEAPHFGEVLHAAQRNARDAADRLAALAGDLSQPAIARATAVERLRDHARPEHLLGVEPMLRDQDALVRAAAVRFLELADLRTRIEQGWPLLDDPARTVRLEAARVLAPVMRQRLPEIYGKKLQATLEEYATAQAVNAERPESHHNMGLLFASQGKAKRAEQAYRAAIRVDPLFTPAYVNLADLYRQQGRDGDGEKVLRTAVSAVRDAAELHHALGLLMVRDKRMSESVVHLKRAAELAPKHTRYAYVYALALQRLGREEHAIRVLEQALVRDDASPEVRMALASLHKARGELEAARRHLSILRKRNPNDRAAEKLWEELEQR